MPLRCKRNQHGERPRVERVSSGPIAPRSIRLDPAARPRRHLPRRPTGPEPLDRQQPHSSPSCAFPNIDPVALSIGPVAVHWYGLAYVVGILLGWFYARRLVATPRLWRERHAADDRWPSSTTSSSGRHVGIVLGGRIGYILFYDFAGRSSPNPLRAFQIWNGGMSFHGGLTGTTIAMIPLRPQAAASASWACSTSSPPSCRSACSSAASPTSSTASSGAGSPALPWAVVFPMPGRFARHPSQLYEAGLEGLVLLVVLAIVIYRASGALKRAGPRHRHLRLPAMRSAASSWNSSASRMPQLGYLVGGWLTMGMVLSAADARCSASGRCCAPGAAAA